MPTISETITGDTPVSVDLLTLVRTDTDETIGTMPQPMTLVNGAWVYTFTAPTAGLTYAYTFRMTWADTSSDDAAGTFVDRSTAAEGYYVQHAKVIRKAGVGNFAQYSNLGDIDSLLADEANAQEAFNEIDRYVDERARFFGLTAETGATPPHWIATTNASFGRISDLASADAIAELYQARGRSGDENNKAEGQMSDLRDAARKELDEILQALAARGVADAGTGGIEVVMPSCDPCRLYPAGWPAVY